MISWGKRITNHDKKTGKLSEQSRHYALPVLSFRHSYCHLLLGKSEPVDIK
jgi:hypothetical protein